MGDDPKPRLVLLHPEWEDSEPCLAPHAPLAPAGWGAWESPPGRLTHATGTPPSPMRLPQRQVPWATTAGGTTQMVRLNPSLQDTQLSRDGEASTRTDTCAWGGAGPRPQAGQCMATCTVAQPELQRWRKAESFQLCTGTEERWSPSPLPQPCQGGQSRATTWSRQKGAAGRNVLLHGREEITAKECAVPRPGLGGSARGTSRQEK